MSSHTTPSDASEPLDLSKWRLLPNLLILVGGLGALIGFFIDKDHRQFGFSWLLAYMFFLSLCLGGLCLTMLHHLFDASWSVPVRRINEHLGCLLRPMVFLWIPIGALAPIMYRWMIELKAGHADLATTAKHPLFTLPGFYITSVICLLIWWWLPGRLRYWSLRQDETGAVECTKRCGCFQPRGFSCSRFR